MKDMPASIWSMQIWQHNVARSTVSLPSGVLMLKFWLVENGVHSGNPMIMYGLHSRIFENAIWRHSCLLRCSSQGRERGNQGEIHFACPCHSTPSPLSETEDFCKVVLALEAGSHRFHGLPALLYAKTLAHGPRSFIPCLSTMG